MDSPSHFLAGTNPANLDLRVPASRTVALFKYCCLSYLVCGLWGQLQETSMLPKPQHNRLPVVSGHS